jgi:cell division protease FtsH
VYGVVSTGAANDLQQVTLIAREMVMRWGMSSTIGPLAFAEDGQNGLSMARPYSEATAREVDLEVKRIADECFAEAVRLLTDNRNRLDALTQALLAEDSLGEAQILTVTGLHHVPTTAEEVGAATGAVSA